MILTEEGHKRCFFYIKICRFVTERLLKHKSMELLFELDTQNENPNKKRCSNSRIYKGGHCVSSLIEIEMNQIKMLIRSLYF